MSLLERIVKVLDDSQVKYQLLEHSPVYTSEEAARVRPDISLSQGAKAMILKVRQPSESEGSVGQFVMVVVPGDRRIDYKKVKKFLSVKDVTLASPEEVRQVSGVEIGAVPPWGHLFGLEVLADVHLFRQERLAFNAGSHRHSVIMGPADWQRLVNPLVGDFATL